MWYHIAASEALKVKEEQPQQFLDLFYSRPAPQTVKIIPGSGKNEVRFVCLIKSLSFSEPNCSVRSLTWTAPVPPLSPIQSTHFI